MIQRKKAGDLLMNIQELVLLFADATDRLAERQLTIFVKSLDIIEKGWFRKEYSRMIDIGKLIRVDVYIEIHVHDFSVGGYAGFRVDAARCLPVQSSMFRLGTKIVDSQIDFTYKDKTTGIPAMAFKDADDFVEKVGTFFADVNLNIASEPYHELFEALNPIQIVQSQNSVDKSPTLYFRNATQTFSEMWISQRVNVERVKARGMMLYRRNSVKHLIRNEKSFSCLVEGDSGVTYYCQFELNAEDSIRNWNCTCPAFRKYPKACKHLVAMFYAVKDIY